MNVCLDSKRRPITLLLIRVRTKRDSVPLFSQVRTELSEILICVSIAGDEIKMNKTMMVSEIAISQNFAQNLKTLGSGLTHIVLLELRFHTRIIGYGIYQSSSFGIFFLMTLFFKGEQAQQTYGHSL